MSTVYYILLLALVAWFVYKQFIPVKGVTNINAQQFEQQLKQPDKSIQLIDVREVHEFRQGRIAGAKNIPLSQLAQKLEHIATDKPVYLYCRSGMRSKQAGRLLSRKGYQHIYNLNGGIMAWRGSLVK